MEIYEFLQMPVNMFLEVKNLVTELKSLAILKIYGQLMRARRMKQSSNTCSSSPNIPVRMP
jgi:hypothetical protein